jgi:aerobic C4-dicarboxylate transport protein
MLTTKNAAAVTSGGFTFAATLSSIGTVPVAGITLFWAFDRFMSQMRSMTNEIGNGAPTILVAKWGREFDVGRTRREIAGAEANAIELIVD